MDKIILKAQTLSSIGYFHNYKFPKFVIYYGYIYIINPRKLDIILSLLELLYEFNNYCNFYNNGNITSWIQEKGLASYELLNEISYYKIKNTYDENISDIYSFADYSLKNYSFEQKSVSKYLSHLLKETLKNLVIFDYLYNSKEIFNNYVSEIFNYYKSINMTPTKTFENFIYSILEVDKISLQDELNYINNTTTLLLKL